MLSVLRRAVHALLGRQAKVEASRRARRRFRPGGAGAGPGPDLEARALLSLAPLTQPTADEQYMLELVNRARANPPAEAQRLASLARTDPTLRAATLGWDLNAFINTLSRMPAQPPLAFNTRLIAAARAHDQAMLAANAQFHSPGGYLTDPRVAAAPDGLPYYPVTPNGWATGENVFAFSRNVNSSRIQDYVDYLYAGMMIDWNVPDFTHLKNILNPSPSRGLPARQLPYSEIGIGLLTGANPAAPPASSPDIPANRGLDVGPVIATQEFGWNNGDAFLTGTVYVDRDGDRFYTPGEGLGAVTIFASGLDGQGSYSTTTWASGGYSLKLPPGTYSVVAVENVPYMQATTVTIGQDNVGWSLAYDAGPAADQPAPGDYDGDGRTDLAVYRPDTAQWSIQNSSGGQRIVQFGWPSVDQPVPADYDGDGKTDIAVFRPQTAEWFILGSKAGFAHLQFGMAGNDVPVPGDYDGDGKADPAVFRPNTAEWLIDGSSMGPVRRQFGQGNRDVPVAGDYDGDGKADPAVFRPDTSEWLILGSKAGPTRVPLGRGNLDQPVPGDYDGDGKLDVAVYRPTTGEWFANLSGGGTLRAQGGPQPNAFPLDGDYDGDGKSDFALYQPGSAGWTELRSKGGGTVRLTFGRAGSSRPASTVNLPTLANGLTQRQRVAARSSTPAGPLSAPLRGPTRNLAPGRASWTG
jgi:hypothetical protein